MAEKPEIAFSYEQFEDVVKRFSTAMPEYLLRHRSIAHIAFALQRLRLIESLDIRFTVAIVGQMRVGKSTLLNALIGEDLAPTGVTETTATINWFRYGQGSQCKGFRVHWMDGSTADVPLDRVGDWIGTEANATRTRCLDFFADTDFLRIANVVDTPGTRSVIQTHEDATQGFLADKLEADTLRYGGSADAVVYAINPVGRESDRDLLQLFGERTRLPGASAYNSIAVVQKWEHLQPDPLEEVQKKCQMLKTQLEGKVAAVVPTSGLLARHAAEVPVTVWQSVADLATCASAPALDSLLLSEQDFGDECPSAPVDQKCRQALLSAISWKILPLCIALARRRGITSGDTLRTCLRDASGIPALRDLLQQNFFSRARLIKASTILRKAWEPCEIAVQTLRLEMEKQSDMVAEGREARSAIAARSEVDRELQKAEKYVADSLTVIERDMAAMKDIQREVDDLRYRVTESFKLFDADIESLKVLETHRARFTQEEALELERLFGQQAPDPWSRLGLAGTKPDNEAAISKARGRRAFWSVQKQHNFSDKARICAHACDVLERIIDHLEET
jgi:hypothetical protein